MHVLVTGAAGLLGSNITRALLEQGDTVTATDINPLPQSFLDTVTKHQTRLNPFTADLCSPSQVDALFDSLSSPLDAVVHVGGVRSPVGMDPRMVHNINATSTYNILYTAVSRGVRNLVQASSCNALGLSWTKPEHWGLDYVPVDEGHPKRPEDAYSLSKLIIEEQAASLCRLYPGTRIASLRMHFTRQSVQETTSGVKHTGLWAWTSIDSVVNASLLALSSNRWEGAEVFHICDDEISYPLQVQNGELSSLKLLEEHFPGRVKTINKEWWDEKPNRAFFDTSKAERVLGWRHS